MLPGKKTYGYVRVPVCVEGPNLRRNPRSENRTLRPVK
jgi:hypothetical protein